MSKLKVIQREYTKNGETRKFLAVVACSEDLQPIIIEAKVKALFQMETLPKNGVAFVLKAVNLTLNDAGFLSVDYLEDGNGKQLKPLNKVGVLDDEELDVME